MYALGRAATGFGIGRIYNIQNVHGGHGGNVLIGDSRGNILIGGTGKNQLFAGSGLSVLIGGKGNTTLAGAGDDLIIGGFTAYDNNVEALMSIFAEWQSADSYAVRLQDLRLGGGANGTNTLSLGFTVYAVGQADRLTGHGAANWFFAGAFDKITDLQPGEAVN